MVHKPTTPMLQDFNFYSLFSLHIIDDVCIINIIIPRIINQGIWQGSDPHQAKLQTNESVSLKHVKFCSVHRRNILCE